MKLQAREILFEEGKTDGKLFVVHKGELVVQKREGSRILNKGTLGAHSIVGEQALFNDAPYPFTLRATENVDVEAFSRDDLDRSLQEMPVWFSPFLHFMADRLHKLEMNKSKLDRVHALPALFFICARYLRKSESGILETEVIADSLETINGLEYNETVKLLQALCELGAAEIIRETQIHFYRKNLPSLLYRTLFARMTEKDFPRALLSANDQTILTAFIATAKTKGREEDGIAHIYAKDFAATYKNLFPGIRLTKRAFENLTQCGYISCEPAFSPQLEFKDIEQFYAHKESVKDLLELNRIYPLLDKRLLEAMNRF